MLYNYGEFVGLKGLKKSRRLEVSHLFWVNLRL